MGLPQPDDEAQEYLDKQKEVVMSGLENIQKANQGQQQVKEDNQDGKTNPTKIDGGKAAVDNPGVKKEGQKQQKTNNFGELTDEDLANYYTKDLRTAVRGLMKLGIKGE
ncbi:hypothetical protein ACTFSJ_27830 [Bacillus cereus group sp. MYBK12-2]|uniref:hypothetical protein n=1 Tax=Bacillus cereus group sp. MYBK12-2 TaxID=3450689 RepID=UPI003F7A686B